MVQGFFNISGVAGGWKTPQPRILAAKLSKLADAEWIKSSLDGGYTPGQVETQFAGSFHAEDWALIKAACTPVLARDV